MTKLETIQKVFGVFKIIARVGMIVCYVAAALAVAGGIIYPANGETALLKFGETTVYMPFNFHSGGDASANEKISWIMISGGIGALFKGVLLTFACRYFTLEQTQGTPFTEKGAKSLLTLGILSIALSAVEASVRAAIYEIMKISEIAKDFSSAWGVILGVCLILFSLIAKYGAELEQKVKNSDNSTATDKSSL